MGSFLYCVALLGYGVSTGLAHLTVYTTIINMIQ